MADVPMTASPILHAAMEAPAPQPLQAGGYAIESPANAEGNDERRLRLDGIHFGSLVNTPAGHLHFRGRPDMSDPNGFGSTYYLGPFFADAAEASGAAIDRLEVTAAGIELVASGPVRGAGSQTLGDWTWSGTICYDLANQRVTADGQLDINLTATVMQVNDDLNLDRIASNYLVGVPLQNGEFGNTGDTNGTNVSYSLGGGPSDFSFTPTAAQPATAPQQQSPYLKIEVVGDTNTVDTLRGGEVFQIAVARKPTVSVTYETTTPNTQMITFLDWQAEEAQMFERDNFAAHHIIRFDSTAPSQMQFDVAFDWSRAANDSPVVRLPLRDRTANAGQVTRFHIGAAFLDGDADTLTYAATLADGSPLPAWLKFDGETFTAAPVGADAGVHDIRLTADDGHGGVAVDTFTVTVEGSAATNSLWTFDRFVSLPFNQLFKRAIVNVDDPAATAPAEIGWQGNMVTWQFLLTSVNDLPDTIVFQFDVGQVLSNQPVTVWAGRKLREVSNRMIVDHPGTYTVEIPRDAFAVGLNSVRLLLRDVKVGFGQPTTGFKFSRVSLNRGRTLPPGYQKQAPVLQTPVSPVTAASTFAWSEGDFAGNRVYLQFSSSPNFSGGVFQLTATTNPQSIAKVFKSLVALAAKSQNGTVYARLAAKAPGEADVLSNVVSFAVGSL